METKILPGIGILAIVSLMISGCITIEDKNISKNIKNISDMPEINLTDSLNITEEISKNQTANINDSISIIIDNTTDNALSHDTTNNTNNKTGFTNTSETLVQATIKTTIKNIDAKEAYKLIGENSDNENFIIIDIRTPSEFNSGHIKNAININYYANDFIEQLKKLDKNKTYLVYCKSGGRSSNSMEIFEQLEFRLIYHMLGGINSWKSEGFPVEYTITFTENKF